MKRVLSGLYRRLPSWVTRTLLYWLHAKFIHGAVAVVQDSEGRVLVLKHVYRQGLPWGFPSGLVKTGEDAVTGALRELLEETGLEASVSDVGPTILVGRRHLETIVYATVSAQASPVLSHEIFEARWVDPQNLPDEIKDGLPPDQHRLMMTLPRHDL